MKYSVMGELLLLMVATLAGIKFQVHSTSEIEPVIVVAFENEITVITCGDTDQMSNSTKCNWQFQRIVADRKMEKFEKPPVSPANSCGKKIVNASSLTAGRYTCNVSLGGAVMRTITTQLIVLESKPVLQVYSVLSKFPTDFTEGETIVLKCDIAYKGNLAPSIKWTMIGPNVRSSDEQLISEDVSEKSFHGASKLSIKLRSSHNGADISCRSIFQQSNHVPAENNQKFEYISNSEKLRVSYAPKTIKFTPLKDVYILGESIQCWADGNPDPAYWWVDLESGNVTSGSTFSVDGSLVDRGEVSFNCTAYVQGTSGEVGWSVSKTIKFVVVPDITMFIWTSSIGGVAIGFPILIGCCVFVFFSIKRKTAKAVKVVLPNGEVQSSANSRVGYEVTVLEEHDDSSEDYSVLVSDDEGNYSDDSSRIHADFSEAESTDSLNLSAYENMRERNSIGPSSQRDSRDRAHYMRSEYIHTNNDSDDVNTGDSDVTVEISDVDKDESDAESGVYYNVSELNISDTRSTCQAIKRTKIQHVGKDGTIYNELRSFRRSKMLRKHPRGVPTGASPRAEGAEVAGAHTTNDNNKTYLSVDHTKKPTKPAPPTKPKPSAMTLKKRSSSEPKVPSMRRSLLKTLLLSKHLNSNAGVVPGNKHFIKE